MKLACVVGTRPQLIKAAAVWPTLRTRHEPVLVDTGQHYDEELAGAFFEELGLPQPDHELGVGSGSHARQVAAMLERLEPVLLGVAPRAVVVFGDTNSTLAGALAAAKLELRLAHVEAGLRSFDRRMPEEVNRVIVDHLADLLFAPTDEAVANLRAEGIGAPAAAPGLHATQDVLLVGDLMRDLCAATLPAIRDPAAIREAAQEPIESLGLDPGGYLFATVHRAENRQPGAIEHWTRLLDELDRPVVLALHPGTKRALDEHGAVLAHGVHLVPPLGYRTTLALQLHAAAVITDSGGIQREADWLGVPALVLRETTEWPETLESAGGRAALVGTDVDAALAALDRLAPAGTSAADASRRASAASVEAAGAATAIAEALGRWEEGQPT
ncbi:MAG TPA: UDP-N-acetylglucosamine 2-epimerase (non-hydrolyzing) [Candidatus Limnocylindrales bacterium]|nr:UDP-N-acetylglucosamine 2-epimerase (non-hydrolyzing) [Candidatus Limnocylindrales bacterium]